MTQFQIKKEGVISREHLEGLARAARESSPRSQAKNKKLTALEPAATASPGNLLETQISNPTSDLQNLRTESQPSPQDVLTHT